MIAQAVNRTWQQILHPKFRSVFITSVLAAIITLTVLTLTLNHYWPEKVVSGYRWIDEFGDFLASAGYWTIVMLGSYLLFPAIVTMVMGLFADQIATAVEEEYYPNRIGIRKVPFGDVIISALKLTIMILVLNLIALFPYLLLLLFTGGIGTLALYIALNGFLIGREYYEMVAIRHMDRQAVAVTRQRHGNKIFMGGAIVSAMFLVPVLNLIAPIAGAAIMTHVFHNIRRPEASRVQPGNKQ
ncbi:EI24 domain-containing protein [Kordiimonas pumila]|uniref:EI24 domain-containing protein n=1 Tax=Kordiimonas pumila TaxID=2161677 RepID=A0ABV7D5U2_9PROT|nr:EI24 domain-containing protein [Kordiimonas pumila]